MPSVFAYLTSEVDWCEGNFEHSEVIAEYYNTISNVSFFLLFPILLYLNHQYVQQRPLSAYSLSIMVLVTGIFSTYYHVTLSYVGQLLDELSILWTLALTYTFWFPKCHFPGFIKDRTQFVWLVGIATVACTLMSFIKPAFNAYLLNSISLHLLYLTCQELKKHVLISIALLYCCPLFIYFDSRYEIPAYEPELEYWPSDSWPVALPYLALRDPYKQC
nr:alkaline ceramidase 1 isoform X2 [Pelodiscus sinensis]|eukprot:XP_006125598.1 alkaline ceramidase 1 isoform X2 [Pelodiscus sinensis]